MLDEENKPTYEQLEYKLSIVSGRCESLTYALISRIDKEIKRWENRIKYIDTPKETMTKEDKLKYYRKEISREKGNKQAIIRF